MKGTAMSNRGMNPTEVKEHSEAGWKSLGRVIDEIEAVLAPYFLGLVGLITLAGWLALWWKLA
jgi:hypothetical protein